MTDTPKKLPSTAWLGGDGKDAFVYRAWIKNQGIPDDSLDGSPVVGICNPWSELTPWCPKGSIHALREGRPLRLSSTVTTPTTPSRRRTPRT